MKLLTNLAIKAHQLGPKNPSLNIPYQTYSLNKTRNGTFVSGLSLAVREGNCYEIPHWWHREIVIMVHVHEFKFYMPSVQPPSPTKK